MTPIARLNRWLPLVTLTIFLLTFLAAGLAQRGRGGGRSSSKSLGSSNSVRTGSVKHSSKGTSGRGRSSSGSRTQRDRGDNRSDRRDDRPDDRDEGRENRQDNREERYENTRRSERWERVESRYDSHRRRLAVGTLMRTLPRTHTTVVVTGTTYYVADDVYYTRSYTGGQVTYIVVTQP